MMNQLLKNLNERQQEAVQATEGSVRIIAGAGSGKTRVIAHRYAYLVNVLGVDPGNILCMTFTNKAAQEMKHRISRLVDSGLVTDYVCTIHGFCVKFLRKEIHRLGYPKTFTILDDEDKKAMVKRIMEAMNIDRKKSTVNKHLAHIGKTKGKMRMDYVAQFMLPHSKAEPKADMQFFCNYLKEQLRLFAVDFDDLMYFTLYILHKFPEVRKAWQSELNYLQIDEVQDCDAMMLYGLEEQKRNDLVKFCYEKSIRIYVAPEISDLLLRGADRVHSFDTPFLLLRNSGISFEQRVMKRAMDVIISGCMLLVASPFMLLTAIAIKMEDHGPALFKQERVTLNGRKFYIYKFRSMIVDAEKNGAQFSSKNDSRITKVGKFIRATRLDELPQLLNILKGDMSIVGPRPERQQYIDEFCKETPEFIYRLKVKAGLTGYAQIYGKYNTTPLDKLKLDLMYIESYSVLLDMKLIFLTLKIMFTKESTEGVDEGQNHA